PDPELTTSDDYVGPVTKEEKLLCVIWSEVLGIDKVGVTDDFYSIGGDSIRSIQICSLIKKEGYKLTVKDILTYKNIESIAKYLSNENSENKYLSLAKNIEKQFENLKNKFYLDNVIYTEETIVDVFPMSDIQQGMFFHYSKEHNIYHDQMLDFVVLKLFDVELFKKSLTLMVEKHEILRTSFELSQNKNVPLQIVHKNVAIDFTYQDLSGLSNDELKITIKSDLEADFQKAFDIEIPGLWRYKVYALGNDLYAMCFIFHHAIIDGWSRASLNTELKNIYLKLQTDVNFVPKSLKSSYKDYIIEQKIQSQNESVKKFWKNELLDYSRYSFTNKSDEEKFNSQGEIISNELYELIKSYAKQQKISIRALCYSAFLYCLNLFSYQNDLTTGLVTSKRPEKEDGDKILGCFLNTIPFRFLVLENITWNEFTHSVQKKLDGLNNYSHFSLIQIMQAIGEPTSSKNPIFDIVFSYVNFHVYDNLDGEQTSLNQGKIKRIEKINDFTFERSNANFEISVNSTGDILSYNINYLTSFIEDESVIEFRYCFEEILKTIIHNATNKIDRNYFLEKKQLLHAYNDTAVAYPLDRTVIDLFEDQVEKAPDNVAVSYLSS
ncbi:condensation domain-containing protein, partial [Maribacter sp. 2307UL18-2]|uniref:condensation domain-containing protein n=1 Tax=Maribacter sp. 2307UL18-2 TaxID=3386274 RepID=UPI0039BC4516